MSLEQQFDAVFQESSATNSITLAEKNSKDFAKVVRHEMSAYKSLPKLMLHKNANLAYLQIGLGVSAEHWPKRGVGLLT